LRLAVPQVIAPNMATNQANKISGCEIFGAAPYPSSRSMIQPSVVPPWPTRVLMRPSEGRGAPTTKGELVLADKRSCCAFTVTDLAGQAGRMAKSVSGWRRPRSQLTC